MNRPTVLHLVDSFHHGGTERQAVQLVRLLHESGRFRVRVACLSPEGAYRGEVERLGLGEIESYPLTSFYDRNAVAQVARFARSLERAGVDVLHTHDFYTNVFGMAAGALARVPVRVASRRETGGTRTASQKRVERLAYRLAHAVVANAEAVRTALVEEGVPETKTVTVYNGLDLHRLAPALTPRAARARFGLPPGSRVVTLVANMRLAVKDQPTFLGAARLVVERHPETVFALAGEGELRGRYEALARELGIEGAVRFLGACDRVADLLAASDVCVLSSRAEGFSNSILEYMAAAKPVVATDVGGAREAIVDGETGYLVDAGDVEALADRVGRLVGDSARAAAMGVVGRERVERHFSCAAQLSAVEALYLRAAAERREPALARRVAAADGGGER
jgi:glycosyltransferase involved in cell wall biosynthesis